VLALQDVSAAINSSLDLDVVLQQTMDAIIRLTRAERAMLLLRDGSKLVVKVARNLSQETLADASLNISRSIVRQVAKSGEAIVTMNAQEDESSARHSTSRVGRLASSMPITESPAEFSTKPIKTCYLPSPTRQPWPSKMPGCSMKWPASSS
jgi:GAF domain-containing protein